MKPKKYIVAYHSFPYYEQKYQIQTTYIIYNGNIINDIKQKFHKTIICDCDKLDQYELQFDKSISCVEKKLRNELRKIGANSLVIRTTVKELMQKYV